MKITNGSEDPSREPAVTSRLARRFVAVLGVLWAFVVRRCSQPALRWSAGATTPPEHHHGPAKIMNGAVTLSRLALEVSGGPALLETPLLPTLETPVGRGCRRGDVARDWTTSRLRYSVLPVGQRERSPPSAGRFAAGRPGGPGCAARTASVGAEHVAPPVARQGGGTPGRPARHEERGRRS